MKYCKIYFCYFDSTRFGQCVELAKLAYKCVKVNINNETIYVVFVQENQIDLLVLLYKLSYPVNMKISRLFNREYYNKNRKLHHKLKKFIESNKIVTKKLTKKGYLKSNDISRIIKKPKEVVQEYIVIRNLIKQEKYNDAVQIYYKKLGNKKYDMLQPELVYLKRLGNIHLTGRDILYYKTKESRSRLINNNLEEYCDLIDKVLEEYKENRIKLPMEIIMENIPLYEKLFIDESKIVQYDENKLVKHYKLPEEKDLVFTREERPEGRLFDRYFNLAKQCNVFNIIEKKIRNVWIKESPKKIKKKIFSKGYKLLYIDYYAKKNSVNNEIPSTYFIKTNKEGFFTEKEMIQAKINFDYTLKLDYTGNIFSSDKVKYFEVDILYWSIKDVYHSKRKSAANRIYIGNPFRKLVNKILRNAENMLREQHGLPKIGEGWISEMEMYNLIKNKFKDAIHHASPNWLKPQHFDVYVPSEGIAFEYQGKQHFEPVDFFGGKESFENMKQLDIRKKKKCKKNKILLIEWFYDEEISELILHDKLKKWYLTKNINDNKKEK